MLDWLMTELMVFSLPTTILELLAFVTGVAAVWLAAKNHILQWPIGFINSVLFLWVFWEVGLYADFGLMIFFAVTCIWGWYWWLHGGKDRDELPTRKTGLWPFKANPPEERRFDSWRNNIWLVLAVMGLAWLVMGTSVDRFTDSDVAFWDAGTTAISLAAQYLLVRRLVANWYAWMIVDVLYVGLYTYKELYFSAILYVVFFCICIYGLIHWRRDERVGRESDTVHPVHEALVEAGA